LFHKGKTHGLTASSLVWLNAVGQHSIRINDQYRVCLVLTAAGPDQVEIVDYHP
jgi:plasmid maintenance system killer protein